MRSPSPESDCQSWGVFQSKNQQKLPRREKANQNQANSEFSSLLVSLCFEIPEPFTEFSANSFWVFWPCNALNHRIRDQFHRSINQSKLAK
jgi:hypothetical protein